MVDISHQFWWIIFTVYTTSSGRKEQSEVARRNILKDVQPDDVQRLLNENGGKQDSVARRLGVTQGSLSLYMKRHGFVKVERWERHQGVQS
jgi:transcriptional regulator with GAF, ATPase, and Fis domain